MQSRTIGRLKEVYEAVSSYLVLPYLSSPELRLIKKACVNILGT